MVDLGKSTWCDLFFPRPVVCFRAPRELVIISHERIGNSTGHGVLMGSNSPQASHGPMDIPWACGIPMAHGPYVAHGGVEGHLIEIMLFKIPRSSHCPISSPGHFMEQDRSLWWSQYPMRPLLRLFRGTLIFHKGTNDVMPGDLHP